MSRFFQRNVFTDKIFTEVGNVKISVPNDLCKIKVWVRNMDGTAMTDEGYWVRYQLNQHVKFTDRVVVPGSG